MIWTWETREQADRKALARLLACLEQTLGWEPDHDEREIVVRSERGDDFVRALEKCKRTGKPCSCHRTRLIGRGGKPKGPDRRPGRANGYRVRTF